MKTGTAISSPIAEIAGSTPPARKPYRAPQLTVFGPLTKLTQNGTGSTAESKGKGFCGTGFNTKGGANC